MAGGLVMVAALLMLLVSIWNTPPATLGEASMREAVRRQRMAPSTMVIGNGALPPVAPPVAAPPPDVIDPDAVPPLPPPAAPPVPAAPPAAAEVKDAAWWRARITIPRDAVARDRILVEALQSRVWALDADIAGRDDPAQRAQLMSARQQALGELERTKKQIDTGLLTIAAIEAEARKAGVPPGWIR
jgi:hypothetical protein